MSNTLLDKDAVLDQVDQSIEDLSFQLKRAKAPNKIRGLKYSLKFWKSVKHHLEKDHNEG